MKKIADTILITLFIVIFGLAVSFLLIPALTWLGVFSIETMSAILAVAVYMFFITFFAAFIIGSILGY